MRSTAIAALLLAGCSAIAQDNSRTPPDEAAANLIAPLPVEEDPMARHIAQRTVELHEAVFSRWKALHVCLYKYVDQFIQQNELAPTIADGAFAMCGEEDRQWQNAAAASFLYDGRSRADAEAWTASKAAEVRHSIYATVMSERAARRIEDRGYHPSGSKPKE